MLLSIIERVGAGGAFSSYTPRPFISGKGSTYEPYSPITPIVDDEEDGFERRATRYVAGQLTSQKTRNVQYDELDSALVEPLPAHKYEKVSSEATGKAKYYWKTTP